MNLLPQNLGNRPRLACEITTKGVVAARSPAPGAPLAAVARVDLAEDAVMPSLRPGNIADRVATITAVRRALEQVGARPNTRNANLTLVIPDGAVRVLLLDFDALPTKLTEALPLVRFRLKRLVPFDPDQAMVTFQIMSSTRGAVRVLAVALPLDVLSDYETVVREAGFEPGSVLPSTLAALAGLPAAEGGSLVVNVYPTGVTTAIVRNGVLLLHRTVELTDTAALVATESPSLTAGASAHENLRPPSPELLPLVDREETAEEWAAQEPLPEFGRNPYADAISAEAAVEEGDSLTGMPRHEYAGGAALRSRLGRSELSGHSDFRAEAAPIIASPYAAEGVSDDLQAEIHNSFLTGVPAGSGRRPGFGAEPPSLTELTALGADDLAGPVHTLAPEAQAEEIARAVSVAVAYFEDILSALPEVLLSAGPIGADKLARTLAEQGLLTDLDLRCRELVDASMLATEAASAAVPRSALAGVVGALRS